MSDRPVVIKLGGDALATPQRIVAQAERLARQGAAGPVVAVTSARRGVTDHLLGLAQEITATVRRDAPTRSPAALKQAARAESDRAVASGEIVSASLLALALNQLGVPATSLDAREAGVLSKGQFGDARITGVVPRRIESLLSKGVIPVVTGFQGWQRGRVATLGRGGTDTSAVALAIALKGDRTVFVKEAHGLRTADPKLVPDASRIDEAPHRFLSALTAAGAKVIQAEAAKLAESHGLRLEFWSLDEDVADSVVHHNANPVGLRAVATCSDAEEGRVTVLAGQAADLVHETDLLRAALHTAGVIEREIQPAANGLRFVVPSALVAEATRALHTAFVSCRPNANALRAS